VERYLTYVAGELARRGHQVTVVGGERARMAPVLAEAGVAHVPASTTADVVRAAVRATRPDVVHTHLTAAEMAGVASRPLIRRPLVTTRHFAAPRGHGRLTRLLGLPISRFMAEEIAISQFVADHAGSPCTVIPTGVPARPRSLQARRPVMLVAQRFEAEKDTATVLRAWGRSGLRSDGWELHLAGRGADGPQLTDLVAQLGLGASVIFLGHVDDLDRRMDEAALLVASAPAEPFGLTVVEAMASGLPVVAADGGAHREILGPVAPELLFVPGDPDDLSRALRALAADPARRLALEDVLRARFEAEYTVERHVDQLEALYERVTRR
jgi:glycosyltransferase involved in cell wall biosynthesis